MANKTKAPTKTRTETQERPVKMGRPPRFRPVVDTTELDLLKAKELAEESAIRTDILADRQKGSKITYKLIGEICSAVAQLGVTGACAAGRLGVSAAAYGKWMLLGQGIQPASDPDLVRTQLHVDLYARVTKAREQYEIWAMAQLRKSIEGGQSIKRRVSKQMRNGTVIAEDTEEILSLPNVQYAAWILERTRADRYGRSTTLIPGNGGQANNGSGDSGGPNVGPDGQPVDNTPLLVIAPRPVRQVQGASGQTIDVTAKSVEPTAKLVVAPGPGSGPKVNGDGNGSGGSNSNGHSNGGNGNGNGAH